MNLREIREFRVGDTVPASAEYLGMTVRNERLKVDGAPTCVVAVEVFFYACVSMGGSRNKR
jgi:hypothetical protein